MNYYVLVTIDFIKAHYSEIILWGFVLFLFVLGLL